MAYYKRIPDKDKLLESTILKIIESKCTITVVIHSLYHYYLKSLLRYTNEEALALINNKEPILIIHTDHNIDLTLYIKKELKKASNKYYKERAIKQKRGYYFNKITKNEDRFILNSF
jgi:hypothetical protein